MGRAKGTPTGLDQAFPRHHQQPCVAASLARGITTRCPRLGCHKTVLCLCVTPPRTCCGCSGTQERLTPGLLACCRATCSVVNPLTSCTLFPPSPPRRRRRPGSGCGRSYVLIHSSDEHASACQGRGGHCQQWCVMQYSNLCLAVGPLCGLCGWLPSVTQHIPLDCPIINASQVRARQVWSNRSRPRHCRPGSSHSRSQPVSGRTTRSGLRHRRGSASPCCDCGHSSHSPTLSPYDMSCTAHCATVLRRHRTPPRCPYDRRRAVEVLLLSSNFSLAPHARARARLSAGVLRSAPSILLYLAGTYTRPTAGSMSSSVPAQSRRCPITTTALSTCTGQHG